MKHFFSICNLILFSSTPDGEVVKTMKTIPDCGTLFPNKCKLNYTQSTLTAFYENYATRDIQTLLINHINGCVGRRVCLKQYTVFNLHNKFQKRGLKNYLSKSV